MASAPSSVVPQDVDYPDSDGKPVGETEVHRDNLLYGIDTLQLWFENDPSFYVTGNMFLYYVRGDKRRHVSPDLFVVRGVPKQPRRRYYLLWEEGKAPEVVIEMTSPSTRKEDLKDKFELYRDTLKVQEYFLFDPYAEYLKPPLQGYRLSRGRYVPIKKVRRRLPSEILGLHLERDGWELRFYDPASGQRVPTRREAAAQAVQAAAQAVQAVAQAREELQQVEETLEDQLRQVADARRQAEAEADRLRQELARLRRDLPGRS